jgi:hypothetical protein
MMMTKAKQPWPRLSETLTGPRHPNKCQSCGIEPIDQVLIERWCECDAADRREPIVVVLCRDCSKRLIEPHPRLYVRLLHFEPMIGVMELCLDCKHRDGTRCINPKAQINGGPGLSVIYPKPTSVHVCRSPRSQSGWHNIYHGPATACDGREEIALPTT